MKLVINFVENFNKQSAIELLIAILIVIVFYVLAPIFSYCIIKVFNIKRKTNDIKNNTFYNPLNMFFKVTGIYFAILFLKETFNFSENFIIIVTKIYRIMIIITLAHSFANSVTKKSRFVKRIKEKSEKEISDTSIKFLLRIIRGVIYIIAVFLIFTEIGYDLSGLITGLGLGSVVLTLAAQDTIKDMLGGLFIFMDSSFKVGDYIKILNYEGTVCDVTFRSTKIKTLDNSIVQIPNSKISAEAIENLSKIDMRRYKLDLGIVLSTSTEKIENLKNEIINVLQQNEKVIKEKIMVYFNEVGTSSYNMFICCYFNTSDYTEYLKLKEQINKNIIDVVNKNNIELAYDTKTIEIKNT